MRRNLEQASWHYKRMGYRMEKLAVGRKLASGVHEHKSGTTNMWAIE